MRVVPILIAVVFVAAALLFIAVAAPAQTYVGDSACSGCHANMPSTGFFEGYMNSGHPWKIFRTQGLDPAVDTWPHTPVPPLPMANSLQLMWSDVEYVIGNYYWKARFIDRQGYIWTGSATDSTQWNLQTQEFVQYHAGEADKPFDCGKCHTTGYDPAGNQHNLPGLVGTWTEDGVRCEACHGPASDHVANTSTPPPGGKDCADCHFRDAQFRMPWSGGFMRHHQQSEDLSHSTHQGLTCESCHNPHRSTVYDDGGVTTTCSDVGCHPGNAGNNNYVVRGKETIDCIDCHMPFMGKSGQKFNDFTGDIRGHLFGIMTDPIAAADNVTDGFWNQDANGDAFVTLDYACMGCHMDNSVEVSLSALADRAKNIHTKDPTQSYAGDQACSGCHANTPSTGFFEGYMNSGHPWKIFRTAGLDPAVDTWPHTPVPPLPMANNLQLLWSDVEYVIGNYYWKARFIDRQGYIWTGSATDSTQWNLQTEEFVQYHAGEADKPFDCGKCHTTGYDPAGNQHSLPGLVGTWTEDGVRCEACHGPASEHVASPSGTPPAGGKDCAQCHFRDAEFRMPWSGGFMRHHQQSEDLSHSSHQGLTCESCHNPHRSTVYDDGGVTTTCSDVGCHVGNVDNNNYVVRGKETVDCIDCHMPFMGKSGQKFNDFTGDIRGHLFQIMTDPIAAADNVTGGFWNQDVNGDAFVTLDYSCTGCHLDNNVTLSLEALSAAADSIHYKDPTPVRLASLSITREGGGAVLEWEVISEENHAGFHVYRQLPGEDREVLTHELLSGRTQYRFVDPDAPEVRVNYWLAEVSRTGTVEWYGPLSLNATAISVQPIVLAPVWPNPFGSSATITYTLSDSRPVDVAIFDLNGRQVWRLVRGVEGPGDHEITWDGMSRSGTRVAAGIYVVQLRAGADRLMQKVVYAP